MHGIFHFDKGLLYTIKELFTRPGHSIREYIQGKRVKHFNYFTTVLFILALDYLIVSWFHIDISHWISDASGLVKFQKSYSKISPFLGIPLYALASYLIFRKSKQNYTENLVLNIYMICGWASISLLFKIVMIFIPNVETFRTINGVFIALTHIYIFVFYYQYFSAFNYKKLFLIVRAILITLLILTMKQLINDTLNEIGQKYLH